MKNTFKKESLQSATILMDPIEQIHLNNKKEEKFENNDNLTFSNNKNSHMSMEGTPYTGLPFMGKFPHLCGILKF
jgi:hypothetical protein